MLDRSDSTADTSEDDVPEPLNRRTDAVDFEVTLAAGWLGGMPDMPGMAGVPHPVETISTKHVIKMMRLQSNLPLGGVAKQRKGDPP
jgi:hypothetical protein